MHEFNYFFLDYKQQKFYMILREFLLQRKKTIPCFEMSSESVSFVIKALLNDMPEFFYFEGKWKLLRENNCIYVCPCYTLDVSKLRVMQYQLNYIICNAISDVESDYDKIKYAYNWMIENVEYGISSGRGQTSYEALVCKKAVCKGVSKGIQLILRKLGVFSTLQYGTLDGVTKHVWNIVEVDGDYYHLDVCMGFERFSFLFEESRKNDVFRSFLVSKEVLSKTHIIFDTSSSYL